MRTANITKLDIPSVRAAAVKIPFENLVIDKWAEVQQQMGKVPVNKTVLDAKVVLFMSAKMLRVLAEDINFRGTHSSLKAIEKVESIKIAAEEFLLSLNESIELGQFG